MLHAAPYTVATKFPPLEAQSQVPYDVGAATAHSPIWKTAPLPGWTDGPLARCSPSVADCIHSPRLPPTRVAPPPPRCVESDTCAAVCHFFICDLCRGCDGGGEQEREEERRRRAAESGEGYVPAPEEEDDEPLDAATEKRMEGKLFYQVLGVDRAAGDKEIRRAYHKLALQLHPDKLADKSPQVRARRTPR